MRILYVASDQTLAEPHGGTVHVMSVSRELARHEHEVHVLFQESPARPQLPDGVTGHTIPATHRFLLWRRGGEIAQVMDQVKPDLVMERYYNFAGTALLRAHGSGIPTVLEVNSPMVEYPGSTKSKVDILLLGALRRRREKMAAAANLIVTPLRDIIPEAFREKAKEIEWGADTELFDPAMLPDRHLLRLEKGFDPSEVLLLHFGSLRKWHGLVKLLEAFDAARPAFGRPVRLVILGPATPLSRPDVHFAGVVPHQDMPSWLKMSDAAVFPFAPEQHRYLDLGFYWSPLKVFEAMAMELPVLTLNHPRLQKILGTDAAEFYYDGSMQDLSQKMIALVQRLPEMEEAGRAFRNRLILSYSWEAHGNSLHQWLSELHK